MDSVVHFKKVRGRARSGLYLFLFGLQLGQVPWILQCEYLVRFQLVYDGA